MIGHTIKLYVMCDEDMVAKSVTVGTPLTTPLTTMVPVVCSRSCASVLVQASVFSQPKCMKLYLDWALSLF